jgi:hypothetical protein
MAAPAKSFGLGDRVRIVRGLFAGHTGTVTAAVDPAAQVIRPSWRDNPPSGAAPEPVWVLLDGCGTSAPVMVRPDELDPA